MLRKSVSEARKEIGLLINQICYGGERAVIHRRDKDCVALVPIEDLRFIEHVENLIDIRDAEKALEEGGEKSFADVLKEIGLL